MQEDDTMMKVLVKEMQVQLSDGRLIPLEDLLEDYEKLLKEKTSKEETSKKVITAELRVGEWFLIDRDVIDKNREKIHRVCDEAGYVGERYWKRFEESNKIADEESKRYTRIIKTYIFKHDWEYKTEQEMRDMCEEIGDGECDEVICDLELQMRICNGESADDLFEKADKLPRVRVIQLRNGGTGYLGGAALFGNAFPPAALGRNKFYPNTIYYKFTPYAFQRELS